MLICLFFIGTYVLMSEKRSIFAPKLIKDEDINHWCERIYRLIYRGGSPQKGLRDVGSSPQKQLKGMAEG